MATEEKDKPDKEEPEGKEDLEPEKPAKAEPQVKEDDDGNVTVDLGTRPARPSRRERRQENYDDLRRAKDENEGLRSRMAALEAQLSARVQAVEQKLPQGDDPYEKQLGTIRQQQEMIQTVLRSGAVTSQEETERLRRQFYELDAQGRKLDRDRVTDELHERIKKEQQPAAGQYEEQVLRAEYPDVIGHPQAMGYARGLYYTMVAEGKPANLATSKEAMDKAAHRFNLRQPPLPVASAGQQAKYGAVPAQAGGRGTGDIRLDPHDKKMALARWPQLDEHQAYAKMAALLQKSREREATE